MNIDRLRWGDWIAAIAGLDLALVTFRAWYKVSSTGAKVTAWDALTNGRYLLIATAVVGVFLLLVIASEQSEMPFPPGLIAAVVGLACTAYVAYRLAKPPTDALDPDVGIYIGLAGAVGVFLGGVLSAREAAAVPTYATAATAVAEPAAAEWQQQGVTTPAEFGGPAEESPGTWSPSAAPGGTWSPAPPATAAGAAAAAPAGAGAVQAGDEVVLTAGGARFPAGTHARVVQPFAGGALVEVVAADGVPDRFEVPDAAFAPAGAAVAEPPTEAVAPGTSGEAWSPAMPAPAGPAEDWGFDESAAAAQAAAVPGEAEAPVGEAPKKVPWWKREIGGGKKKQAGDEGEAGAATAAAAAGAALAEPEAEEAEARPGFFKRLFGGGGKPADEGAETPGAEDDGWGPIGTTDTEADVEPGATGMPAAEPEAEAAPAEPEPEAAPEPAAAMEAAAPEAVAPEPEAAPADLEPPIAAPPEPEPPVAEPAPEPEAEAAPEPEPEPPAVSEPEPEAEAPAEPAAAPEPAAPAEPEPEPEPPAASEPEPEPAAAEAVPEPEAPPTEPEAAAAAAEPPAAEPEAPAEAEPAPEKPKKAKPRRKSSASRKVPKDAVAAVAAPPKVGDQVELKVGGGRWEVGTRGTVVDVFSAGVIVEFADDDGRTERLDLPFEAVGPPADASA